MISVDGVEGRPLYLDAQATTPMDPRVLDAMLPFYTNLFGNPHSRTHAYGWESEKAVETARKVESSIIREQVTFYCNDELNLIHVL